MLLYSLSFNNRRTPSTPLHRGFCWLSGVKESYYYYLVIKKGKTGVYSTSPVHTTWNNPWNYPFSLISVTPGMIIWTQRTGSFFPKFPFSGALYNATPLSWVGYLAGALCLICAFLNILRFIPLFGYYGIEHEVCFGEHCTSHTPVIYTYISPYLKPTND